MWLVRSKWNTTSFHFQATSVPQINGIKLNYNNMYENINSIIEIMQ